MMKPFGIKLIIHLVVVFSIFGMFEQAPLTNILLVGILTTCISFVIGDLFILRRFGNVVASIGDFFLAFITLAVLSNLFLFTDSVIIVASLASAFFITLTEPLLHAYIQEKADVQVEKQEYGIPMGRFQTEFAEEDDTQTLGQQKDPNRDNTK